MLRVSAPDENANYFWSPDMIRIGESALTVNDNNMIFLNITSRSRMGSGNRDRAAEAMEVMIVKTSFLDWQRQIFER